MDLAVGALMLSIAFVLMTSLPRLHMAAPDMTRRPERVVPEGGPDLPCPWCQAPTNEDDRACPSCHQQFG